MDLHLNGVTPVVYEKDDIVLPPPDHRRHFLRCYLCSSPVKS
jgi:hypothetical protein